MAHGQGYDWDQCFLFQACYLLFLSEGFSVFFFKLWCLTSYTVVVPCDLFLFWALSGAFTPGVCCGLVAQSCPTLGTPWTVARYVYFCG